LKKNKNFSSLSILVRISQNKISKVYGQIEEQTSEIFLDSCANINMITRAALKKYKINK
jgi:hypothetical protein